MRRGAVVLLAAVLTACSGGTATTTTTAPARVGAGSPTEAVQRWIDGLVAGDATAVANLVADDQLAVLVAVDNQLTGAATAQLVRAGITDDVRRGYWASFAEGFSEFAGAPLSDLAIGAVEQFSVAEGEFAAVEVAFTTRIGSTEIIAARAADGSWLIDVLATIGPSLVRPLRSILVDLPSGEDGLIVKGLLQSALPSLLAALERPAVADLPADFVLETESLIQLLARD